MMAAQPGTIIEDEQAFLDDVEAFMKERGVPFERDGKVSGRPISLHKLYKAVMAIGGYDKISGERLKWRELIEPFGLDKKHEPAMTFQLKTVYYKNLAAYEIARYWGEEPPPTRILEEVSARGGDLRNRKDNYTGNSKVPSIDGISDQIDDEEGQHTPVRVRQDPVFPDMRDQTGRQLRQDPKRTQLYQNEPTPERNRFPRRTHSPKVSPAPMPQYTETLTDPRNPNFSVDKYQPRGPNPMTLYPVTTPGSQPEVFYQRKAIAKAQSLPRLPPDPRWLDQLKLGLSSHFPSAMLGSTIYTRCILGLQSGIPEEQSFALHHLVKVSYERGEKFTFSIFAGLAEGLLEKCLEITEIVYGVHWKVSYDQAQGISETDTLNACFGTPNLRSKVLSTPCLSDTGPENPLDAEKLDKLNEAALVIRNMLLLDQNALFISKFALFRDFLIIAINLPAQPRLAEFRQYALEMAEVTTRYWAMPPNDPLYLSLVQELTSSDRGRNLSALHAIFKIGVELDENFKIGNLSLDTLQRLAAFTLLDDDELVEATLDVLYMFTAFPENVGFILKTDPALLTGIIPRLTRYLLHDATAVEEKIQNRPFNSQNKIMPTVPRVPQDLYRALCQYPDPERSSRWLRCCFEEVPGAEITQIAIWQAYSAQFHGTQHIAAAEFIKNISTTFTNARAEVITAGGAQPRFVIRGIKPRYVLVDTQGNGYFKCLWEHARQGEPPTVYDGNGLLRHVCGSWYSSRQNLWQHILGDHLGIQRRQDGKFITTSMAEGDPPVNYTCKWIGCKRQIPSTQTADLGIHIRGHCPDDEQTMTKLINELSTIPQPSATGRPTNGLKNANQDDLYTRHTYYVTEVDHRSQPKGISFMAVMILRNLARFVGRHGGSVDVKTPQTSQGVADNGPFSPHDSKARTVSKLKSDLEKRQELMAQLFTVGVRSELWRIVSVHRTLPALLADLIGMIERGEKEEKKRRNDDVDEEAPMVINGQIVTENY